MTSTLHRSHEASAHARAGIRRCRGRAVAPPNALVILLAFCSMMVASAQDQAASPSADPAIAFADRDGPAGRERDARDFFALTWIGEWGANEFRRPGRWEQLGKVRAALDAKDWSAALELYKRHALERLRLCDGFNGWGMSPGRLDPWSVGEPHWAWMHPLISAENQTELMRKADELRQGVVSDSGAGKEPIRIGKPGSVDWAGWSAKAKLDGRGLWPWRVEVFNPLLAAYIISGERVYLDTWAAYADDWALNQHGGISAATVDMPDGWNNGDTATFDIFRLLRGVATIPGGIEALPAGSFARVTARLVRDYLPLAVLYYRTSGTNWTDVSIAPLIDDAFLFDEFHCAPLLLREAIRRLELLEPTRHIGDGTDLDITAGYGFHFLMGAAGAMQRMNARFDIPVWMAPMWEREWRAGFPFVRWCAAQRDRMRARARFLLAHQTANGETPIGGSRTGHNNWSQHATAMVEALVPEVAADPDLAALLTLAAGPMTTPPSFTSECFPVAGFSYLRAGWKPGDPYLFMHCSPHPTGGDLSDRDNNAIGVGAWGADLIDTGEDGAYDQPRSPLRVDGQEQHFRDGFTGWDHRAIIGKDGGLVPWDDAPSWRWSASPRFDLTEGVYAGPYARGITGVSHDRVVIFVRQAGMWIVIDRPRSEAAHAYTLDWYLPIVTGRDLVFARDQIAIDPAHPSIITSREKGPNLSLRMFSSQPLTFDQDEKHGDPKNGYHTHDMLRVGATWKPSAASAVVTVLLARPEHGADLAEVRELRSSGTVGFEAQTPSGARVRFQAAEGSAAVLTVGDASVTGEALLVVDVPGQPRAGIALGGDALVVAGKPRTLPTRDTEFAIDAGGALTAMPIRTPIANVHIEPEDRDAFVASQAVTLSCAMPGAEIRYTVDGGDPTLASTLYAGPFTIAADTVVKARAMLPGLARLPATMSGRDASLVARADYRALPLLPATEAKTSPGLRYERSVGRWQDLLMAPPTAAPAASGRAEQLFAPASLAPGTVSMVRYHGYLFAPADGLYTFQCPSEYYLPNILPGYELRVIVDGVTWYPATGRHALGSWSIGLAKGKHRFEVFYGDFRGDVVERRKGLGVWSGVAPLLELSGPGIARAPVPEALLSSEP